MLNQYKPWLLFMALKFIKFLALKFQSYTLVFYLKIILYKINNSYQINILMIGIYHQLLFMNSGDYINH